MESESRYASTLIKEFAIMKDALEKAKADDVKVEIAIPSDRLLHIETAENIRAQELAKSKKWFSRS
jgi:hypothetical protein